MAVFIVVLSQNQTHIMADMKSKLAVFVFIGSFFLIGLILLVGRYLIWETSLQLVESLFSSDRSLEINGQILLQRLMSAFALFHIVLGFIGMGLVILHRKYSIPFIQESSDLTLFVFSTITAFYLVGLFIISKEVSGIRLPVYQEDALFEQLSAVCYFLASFFFLGSITKIQTRPLKKKGLITTILLLLMVFCFLAFGEEISWGQRLIGWETPPWWAEANYQQETNLHNLFSPLLKEYLTLAAAAALNILIFGFWLLFWNENKYGLRSVLPHPVMFVLLILISVSSGYNEELMEELTAAFMIIYSIWVWSNFGPRSLNERNEGEGPQIAKA